MQNQVDEVVGVMRTNVQKVLERDEKLTDLDRRADRLHVSLHYFAIYNKCSRKYSQIFAMMTMYLFVY